MSKDNNSIHILKKVVVDGLLCCGLLLMMWAINNLWKPFQRGFFCGDQSLMFPYHDDTVTVLMLRGIGISLPLIAIIICEWCVLRKEDEEHRCFGIKIPIWVQGFYCSSVSFLMGYCFVEISIEVTKNVIGRPRPHFFDLCQPSINCSSPQWQDRYIQSTDYHCTGTDTEKLKDMTKSFLSGHSALAAYSMIYVALYLEKRMTWNGTRALRHCLQFTVVMLSWFTALSRVSDFKHHWSDVLAGYIVGALIASLVWNYCTDLIKNQKKHAPLSQHEIALAACPQIALSS